MTSKSVLPDAPEHDQLVEAYRELLPDAPPIIIQNLAQMSVLEKKARLEDDKCPKCGCMHRRYGFVRDASAVEKVLRLVWEYGKGKPRTMEGESSDGIVIRRFVKGIDDVDAAGRSKSLAND